MSQIKEEHIDTPKKALLVSVYKGSEEKALCEEHLRELELLCETYGVLVSAKVPCGIRKYDGP